MKTIGERLLYARKTAAERGVNNGQRVTQQDIADEVGRTRQAIVKIEKGESNSTSTVLAKMADFLQVNAGWLITGDGSMELSAKSAVYISYSTTGTSGTSLDNLKAVLADISTADIVDQVSMIHALAGQILDNADKGRNYALVLRSLLQNMQELENLIDKSS